LENRTVNKGGVICQKEGGVLRLTLDRPDAGNRLTISMLRAIARAVGGAGNDTEIKVAVIGANGLDFCLGGELGNFWEMEPVEIDDFANAFIEALLHIRNCPVPVIVNVAGRAWGGGVCLVDAADLAAARVGASFAIPEILGGRPPVLSFMSASRSLPEKTLMRLALTGAEIDADEALRRGMVSAVGEGEEGVDGICGTWINGILQSAENPVNVIKKLRAEADCGMYERQLRAAGGLLVQALLGSTVGGN